MFKPASIYYICTMFENLGGLRPPRPPLPTLMNNCTLLLEERLYCMMAVEQLLQPMGADHKGNRKYIPFMVLPQKFENF